MRSFSSRGRMRSFSSRGQFNIDWITKSEVKKGIEKKLINSDLFIKSGEFISPSFLSENRVNEIQKLCDDIGGISLPQALSLRKQLLVGKYDSYFIKLSNF
jgi:hypothetical protein